MPRHKIPKDPKPSIEQERKKAEEDIIRRKVTKRKTKMTVIQKRKEFADKALVIVRNLKKELKDNIMKIRLERMEFESMVEMATNNPDDPPTTSVARGGNPAGRNPVTRGGDPARNHSTVPVPSTSAPATIKSEPGCYGNNYNIKKELIDADENAMATLGAIQLMGSSQLMGNPQLMQAPTSLDQYPSFMDQMQSGGFNQVTNQPLDVPTTSSYQAVPNSHSQTSNSQVQGFDDLQGYPSVNLKTEKESEEESFTMLSNVSNSPDALSGVPCDSDLISNGFDDTFSNLSR